MFWVAMKTGHDNPQHLVWAKYITMSEREANTAAEKEQEANANKVPEDS